MTEPSHWRVRGDVCTTHAGGGISEYHNVVLTSVMDDDLSMGRFPVMPGDLHFKQEFYTHRHTNTHTITTHTCTCTRTLDHYNTLIQRCSVGKFVTVFLKYMLYMYVQ